MQIKIVKVCLHSSYVVQIPLQFDDFLTKNFEILISQFFEIFRKKIVKVCLHSSFVVQIPLQFNDFSKKKNIKKL